jgi:butyryl-CoA dehydrogenase
MASLDDTTNLLLEAVRKDVDLALANATLYLDVFGRVMMSWIWLRQALLSSRALADNCLEASEASFYKGKLQAARYYIEWELPEIKPQIEVLNSVSPVCYDMQEEWFQQ